MIYFDDLIYPEKFVAKSSRDNFFSLENVLPFPSWLVYNEINSPAILFKVSLKEAVEGKGLRFITDLILSYRVPDLFLTLLNPFCPDQKQHHIKAEHGFFVSELSFPDRAIRWNR